MDTNSPSNCFFALEATCKEIGTGSLVSVAASPRIQILDEGDVREQLRIELIIS